MGGGGGTWGGCLVSICMTRYVGMWHLVRFLNTMLSKMFMCSS